MTVSELIEKLKEFPQDAEVVLAYHEYADRVEYDSSANEVEIRSY